MYESYWQLRRKPFDADVGEQLYFPAEGHQAALLKLRYAIETKAAAALLVGAGGTGKTLLVQMLKRELAAEFSPFVHLVFPQMPTAELLAYLADELGAPAAKGGGQSVNQSVRRIEAFLSKNTAQGRHAVVVIDEAHLLEQGQALEALRLLLNFETDARPQLTLLLVGQPPLWSAVERNRQLEERLAMKCLLRPLTLAETTAYVEHRLTAAGAEQAIFDAQALEALHEQCGGIPRRANRLCELALLVGYADEQPGIGREQIEAVGEELTAVAV